MAKPAHKVRVGFVTATVWKNDEWYSVTISKSYRDDEGVWKETDSLSHVDVLCAIKALERCETWIASQ